MPGEFRAPTFHIRLELREIAHPLRDEIDRCVDILRSFELHLPLMIFFVFPVSASSPNPTGPQASFPIESGQLPLSGPAGCADDGPRRSLPSPPG